ncbi:MAG: hypothetical protein ACLFVP_06615 [Candidatus Bathyarchaeia archaeon]
MKAQPSKRLTKTLWALSILNKAKTYICWCSYWVEKKRGGGGVMGRRLKT